MEVSKPDGQSSAAPLMTNSILIQTNQISNLEPTLRDHSAEHTSERAKIISLKRKIEDDEEDGPPSTKRPPSLNVILDNIRTDHLVSPLPWPFTRPTPDANAIICISSESDSNDDSRDATRKGSSPSIATNKDATDDSKIFKVPYAPKKLKNHPPICIDIPSPARAINQTVYRQLVSDWEELPEDDPPPIVSAGSPGNYTEDLMPPNKISEPLENVSPEAIANPTVGDKSSLPCYNTFTYTDIQPTASSSSGKVVISITVTQPRSKGLVSRAGGTSRSSSSLHMPMQGAPRNAPDRPLDLSVNAAPNLTTGRGGGSNRHLRIGRFSKSSTKIRRLKTRAARNRRIRSASAMRFNILDPPFAFRLPNLSQANRLHSTVEPRETIDSISYTVDLPYSPRDQLIFNQENMYNGTNAHLSSQQQSTLRQENIMQQYTLQANISIINHQNMVIQDLKNKLREQNNLLLDSSRQLERGGETIRHYILLQKLAVLKRFNRSSKKRKQDDHSSDNQSGSQSDSHSDNQSGSQSSDSQDNETEPTPKRAHGSRRSRRSTNRAKQSSAAKST